MKNRLKYITRNQFALHSIKFWNSANEHNYVFLFMFFGCKKKLQVVMVLIVIQMSLFFTLVFPLKTCNYSMVMLEINFPLP